ncbi:hypothetical protein C5749_12605 [Sphingobacterium gobiense]|uniref:Uncharacterized protein n=2 Tax=Sphingobacterium gobiense TaxID=1382456 RepID=A0A2S9JMB7_9SPHI|nr:hypothetical protein C5749_12605 [Sphingobacterium gobiense]
MHNRLIKYIQRVMRTTARPTLGYNNIEKGNISRLVGFQFNENCHLHDYFHLDPIVNLNDKELYVHFPEFYPTEHLLLPKNCRHILIQIEVFGFLFRRRSYFRHGIHEIEIDIPREGITVEEQTVVFDAPSEPYDTLLVALTILYLDGNGPRSFLYNNKNLHPAAIIGGFNYK